MNEYYQDLVLASRLRRYEHRRRLTLVAGLAGCNREGLQHSLSAGLVFTCRSRTSRPPFGARPFSKASLLSWVHHAYV